MSATYSTNLALELIGTGDQAGNWGATNNLNIGTLLEQAISGYVTQNMPGTDVTLTMSNGASATARNMFIQLTGTGGASLIVPANKKLYFIYNSTSATVTVKVSGQVGLSVPAGAKYAMVCDGTDVVGAINYLGSLSLAAALTVANGGTGVATLAGVAYGNGTSAFTAATGAQIAAAIGSTAVTNATNATTATTANSVANSGGWNVTPSGTKLYFNYNGTNVASLDSSGNLITLADITAYGTP
jgi:hypothetical protein